MTPEELRSQARDIYTNGKPLDNQVTDLIFALVMAQAETMERLDRLIELEDLRDARFHTD